MKAIPSIQMDLYSRIKTDLTIEEDDTLETWTAKLARFNMKIRLTRLKRWNPVTFLTSSSWSPRADHWGGNTPFFSTSDKEWPTCKECGTAMTFLLQATDPSELKILGTVQVFACANAAESGGHSGLADGEFYVRNVYPKIDEYHHIPIPSDTKVLSLLGILRWEESYDSFDYPDIISGEILGLYEKQLEKKWGITDTIIELAYGYGDDMSVEGDEGVTWHGRPGSCQDAGRYPYYALQFSGLGGYMWGDSGILHVFHREDRLVINGDMC